MNLTYIIIGFAIVGVLFAILWRQGYLLRFSNYVLQTREELRKCTWPTREELKASTVLVTVAILLLGLYTVVVDYVFVHVMLWISKA